MLRPVRIRKYLSVMARLGFTSAEVLRGTGIEEIRLHDAGYLVDATQCQAVITNVIRLSGNPGIGFEFGYQTTPSDHGVMGYAVMTCASMRQTADLWNQYSESLVGVLSKLGFKEEGDWVTMSILRPAQIDPIFIFCVEEQLAMIYQISKTLTGNGPVVKRMNFSYPAPAHRHLYDERFKCPLRFNAESTSVVISKKWLERPLKTNDEEFNRICQLHCGQVLREIEHGSPVAAKLRRLFLNDPRNIPNVDVAAREFGMSTRTLRRRLHDEGMRYQELVDKFREQLAREYLMLTDMSPKQVAYQIGFNDVSTFRRAFKMWIGQTVSEYRAQATISR